MENKGQRLAALSSMTLRGLIQKANDEHVVKDDVVTVLRENEVFVLLYYKGNGRAEG